MDNGPHERHSIQPLIHVPLVISEFPSPPDTIINFSPLSKLCTFSLRFKPTLLHPSTIAQTIESAPCTVSKIELIFALNPKTNGEWIPVDNATVALASRCSRTFRTVVKGIQKDEMKKLFPKSSSMDFFQVCSCDTPNVCERLTNDAGGLMGLKLSWTQCCAKDSKDHSSDRRKIRRCKVLPGSLWIQTLGSWVYSPC